MVMLSELEPPAIDMRSVQSEQGFEELCLSIKEVGVLEPILVSPREDGKFEVVFGARRVKAALALGLAKIPAVVKKMDDEEILLARAIENLQREDVSAIDTARYIEKIMAVRGCNQVEVAKMLHLSDGRVSQLLTILRKDPVIRDMVEKGEIPEAVGRELLRHPNEALRHDMANFAKRDGWNQQSTRRYVDNDMALNSGGSSPPPAAMYDDTLPPPHPILNMYPCRLCGKAVRLETMIVMRACPDCGNVLEGAIEQGAFCGAEQAATQAVGGPGDRGAGPGAAPPDAD